jgi:predicted kinase
MTDARPVLVLTVGLPGTGKTTLAKRLADERRILRLTPDDWMAPLFQHKLAALGQRPLADTAAARLTVSTRKPIAPA